MRGRSSILISTASIGIESIARSWIEPTRVGREGGSPIASAPAAEISPAAMIRV
jgi:hypothetical protein